MTMTRDEAAEYVRAADEDDGPESYKEAAVLFAAIFGRAPDADDGGLFDLWSHVCAAVLVDPHTAPEGAQERS